MPLIQVRDPINAQDKLVPIRYPERLFDFVKQSGATTRFVSVDGGHMVHFTKPEVVHPIVERWLAET